VKPKYRGPRNKIEQSIAKGGTKTHKKKQTRKKRGVLDWGGTSARDGV